MATAHETNSIKQQQDSVDTYITYMQDTKYLRKQQEQNSYICCVQPNWAVRRWTSWLHRPSIISNTLLSN